MIAPALTKLRIMAPMVRPTQLLHPQREPAPVRPAATVLLLRDTPQGIEVLMTRRSMTASFAPGAYVFPGGGVDALDAAAHAQASRREARVTTADYLQSEKATHRSAAFEQAFGFHVFKVEGFYNNLYHMLESTGAANQAQGIFYEIGRAHV